jgi:urea transport system ATP-binding protein
VKQIAANGRVTVLHQGALLCEGKFDDVQADPRVREVYLGRGKHGTR